MGVSAVCVLGFNVNQGQEISLRLRTDDMAGLRKYIKVRETLVHELAHMVGAPGTAVGTAPALPHAVQMGAAAAHAPWQQGVFSGCCKTRPQRQG